MLTSKEPQGANPAWLSQLPQLAPKPKFFQPQSTESSQLVLFPPVIPTLPSSVVSMPFNIVSSIPLQNHVVIQPSTLNMSPGAATASSFKNSDAVVEEVYLPVSDTEEMLEEFDDDDDDAMPPLQALCRICAEAAAAEGKQMIEIFSMEGRARNIPDLIMQYLPIEVLEMDRLPLKVCTTCVNTLETCHELILKCKLGDATLRRLLEREENRETSPIPCFDDICESFLQEDSQNEDYVEDGNDNSEVEMIECTHSNCKTKTLDAKLMIKHVSTIHKQYACSTCWKHFKTIKQRNQHKVEVHEGMLLCDLCGESYLGRKRLQVHMKNHTAHSERQFKCDICGKGFTKNCELKLHSSRHLNSKTLKCPKCDKMFYHANDVRLHMKIHAEKGSFKCKECLRSFTCKRYLAVHKIKSHVEEWVFKCKTCEYSASKLKVIAEHCQEKHEINADQLLNHCDISSPFQCDTCKTYFNNIINLREHKTKYHGSCKVRAPRKKMFTCDVCGDLFLSQILCTYHVKNMHGNFSDCIQGQTGGERFECASCPKSFKSKYYLIQHMRTHKSSGVKPYKCQYCVSSFATERVHADHERMHRGETPYQCTYCLQSFPSSNVLQRHKRSHTKPFICQYCGKGCDSKNRLMVHQRVHTGERPFKCKFCEKAYKQKQEMEFHQLTHSMEKKYKCSICNFGDNRMKLVIDHAVTQHGIEENIDDVVVKHNFS
ncbi:hypothetical protein B566_EDAN015104 [Ephemera danica]|nr:hypothetical protein B566_EDAN015104 [Ephemera danica]